MVAACRWEDPGPFKYYLNGIEMVFDQLEEPKEVVAAEGHHHLFGWAAEGSPCIWSKTI